MPFHKKRNSYCLWPQVTFDLGTQSQAVHHRRLAASQRKVANFTWGIVIRIYHSQLA